MAQPIFYQTLNMVGIDPTIFYTNLATAGASFTPEYPAPPFIPGTRAFGSDGSEFIFVQASTSISLTDFVVITAMASSAGDANPFTANSIATANVNSSLAIEIASSGLILKQSVSFIPSGAMFWACTKGNFIPATNSGGTAAGLASASGTAILYTTATPGFLSTSAVSTAGAFAGFTVVCSTTISIVASIIPPGLGNTTANGFTVGPVVSMNKCRAVTVVNSTSGASSLAIAW